MASLTVIKGFSKEVDVKRELPKLESALERERKWYAEAPRFHTLSDILGAVASETLVRVGIDANIKPTRRFRNPELENIFTPFMTPRAYEIYELIGKKWREELNKLPKNQASSNIRLSSTSFVRSQDYQDALVEQGKLAVPDSTHVTGNAFDIDLGGYYLDLIAGGEAAISLRNPSKQLTIADDLAKLSGVREFDPIRLGPNYFRPEITEALLSVALEMHKEGQINAVPELMDTPNRVLHIAVSPE